MGPTATKSNTESRIKGAFKSAGAPAIKESPLFWPAHFKNGVLQVLDETQIPKRLTYIPVTTTAQAVRVIRQMKTRAFGQFLVVLSTFLLELVRPVRSDAALLKRLEKTAEQLNASRPTFPFAEVTAFATGGARQALAEGVPIVPVLEKKIQGYLAGIRARRLERVRQIAALIVDGDSILTHCNVSGELAMAASVCLQEGKHVQFFATETAPYFQGARLTSWELTRSGADSFLIADNAVGTVMADGLVNKVIVGSDRNCANGDFANKIGTYQIAVLAKEFDIPFYVLTQPSTKIAKGADIPVEMRPENELLRFNNKWIAPVCVHGLYPGFDVVPHTLVTGTIPIQVG